MSEAGKSTTTASLDKTELSRICATVTTSFEAVAASECVEKYGSKVQLGRGRIYFSIHRHYVHSVRYANIHVVYLFKHVD